MLMWFLACERVIAMICGGQTRFLLVALELRYGQWAPSIHDHDRGEEARPGVGGGSRLLFDP